MISSSIPRTKENMRNTCEWCCHTFEKTNCMESGRSVLYSRKKFTRKQYGINFVCEIILVQLHCYDMWTSASFSGGKTA